MKNVLKYSLLVLALVLTVSPRAHADDDGGWWWSDPPKHHDPDGPTTAPEVDPSLAFGGLTLLGGTLTVLRSRRRK